MSNSFTLSLWDLEVVEFYHDIYVAAWNDTLRIVELILFLNLLEVTENPYLG